MIFLADQELAVSLGRNARRKIEKMFDNDRSIQQLQVGLSGLSAYDFLKSLPIILSL